MARYRVVPTTKFQRQTLRLERRYASWAGEADELVASLADNPDQGVSLGRGCYKIRVAIASKGRGKSGGARVITLVKRIGETVYLLAVYDKSERDTITEQELDELLTTAGLK